MPQLINIAEHKIGQDYPVFIIAELSANHLRDFNLALKTVEAMKDSGADCVKLQTYSPDTLTIDCNNPYFTISQGTPWDGNTLYQLYSSAWMPWEWHEPLIRKITELGLCWFSTPTDFYSADFLEKFSPPAYKIASFEMTDTEFITHVATKGKPVILSTGISRIPDIQSAVSAVRVTGNTELGILKCTSAYPAPYEEINLFTIQDIESRFDAVCGISDHTLGIEIPVASAALGARIIEKHFILDRSLGGPDSSFSLEPTEFSSMVKAVRNVEKALGKSSYELTPGAEKSRNFARSLFAVENIEKGELISRKNVRSIRPGYGLPPSEFSVLIGKKAAVSIPRGTPLKWEMICS